MSYRPEGLVNHYKEFEDELEKDPECCPCIVLEPYSVVYEKAITATIEALRKEGIHGPYGKDDRMGILIFIPD